MDCAKKEISPQCPHLVHESSLNAGVHCPCDEVAWLSILQSGSEASAADGPPDALFPGGVEGPLDSRMAGLAKDILEHDTRSACCALRVRDC
jgi:hypothetical protein